MPLLDLNGLKALFKKGMDHAKKNYSSVFFDKREDLCDYQVELAMKAPDLTTFMNAVWMNNNTFASAFWDPHAICNGCELANTGVKFGVGNIGWYFLYGVTSGYVYNITLFRLEVAPPDCVDFERSEAVRWGVMGGYGKVGGAWNQLQPEWIYMKYTEPSYSTFTLEGKGNTMSVSFGSVVPMQFYFDISFTDTKNEKHTIASTLTCNTPPTKNFPGSCYCFNGAGTFYYSYTDISISFIANNAPPSLGMGWIDHQLMKSGPLKGWWKQSLQTVTGLLSPKQTSGWLWTSVQDQESGLQYMFTIPLIKYYKGNIKVNKKMVPAAINVYEKGVAHIKPTSTTMNSSDVEIHMLETFSANGVDLPAKYRIVLPGGKVVILKMVSGANVYPNAVAPSEQPAFLYDSEEKKVIGSGLIEANLYLTSDQLASRMIQQAGGNSKDKNKVKMLSSMISGDQSAGQKVLGVFALLTPLWILLLALLFVLYSKEQRHTRLMLSIVLLMLIYGAAKAGAFV
jgi:hypothetical protein